MVNASFFGEFYDFLYTIYCRLTSVCKVLFSIIIFEKIRKRVRHFKLTYQDQRGMVLSYSQFKMWQNFLTFFAPDGELFLLSGSFNDWSDDLLLEKLLGCCV